MRHPLALAQQALSTQAVCEGRFTLGLGASHHWIVEGMLGLPYDRPARQMRHYLEVVNRALSGTGPIDVDNESYRVHSPLDLGDLVPDALLQGPVPLGQLLRVPGFLVPEPLLFQAGADPGPEQHGIARLREVVLRPELD